MDYFVSKKDVLSYLKLIKDNYAADNKRTASAVVQECMDAVEAAKTKTISYQPEESKIVVSLEPFFENGVIGRDVYRCWRCSKRVDKHDAFCKSCGRKLVSADV